MPSVKARGNEGRKGDDCEGTCSQWVTLYYNNKAHGVHMWWRGGVAWEGVVICFLNPAEPNVYICRPF